MVSSVSLPPTNEVCEGYVFTGACLSTAGVCPIACWDTPAPWDQRQTSPLGRPPRNQRQTPPYAVHAGIRSTSGWYASHRNAFLLLLPAMKLGQGNIFTGVCDSVHMGRGLPQCMLGYHPPGTRHHPPGSGTPQDQAPPRNKYPLEPGTCPPEPGTCPPQTRQAPPSPGPGIPSGPGPPPTGTEHTGRYGQRAGGMHPTGMQSCLLLI